MRLRWIGVFCLLLLAVSAVPVLAEPAASEPAGVEALPSSEQFAQALTAGGTRLEAEAEAREEELASPGAEREREASRVAYTSISGAEAQGLLGEAFPEALDELEADPARVVSDAEVEKTLGPHIARVANGEGGGALLESPVPIETGQGTERAPVDLSLQRAGDGYAPQNPLTEVELPDSASGSIELPGGIAVTDLPGAGDPSAHRFGEDDLFFPSTASATDTLVAPKAGGVEVFEQIRSPESPERFRYPLALPEGTELRSDGDGGAEVLGRDGEPRMEIPAPSATDAQGTALPASMSVEGDSVVVELDHRSADIAYPALLDPEFRLISENAGAGGTSLGAWSPVSTGAYELGLDPSGSACPFGLCLGAGLYAQSRGEVSYAAESFGQWVFQAPGTTGYFRRADFSSIDLDVPSKCASEVDPHGYVGIFNVASNSFEGRLAEYHSATSGQSFSREMSPDGNLRVAAAGIGTHVGKTPPCHRDFFLGGASFVFEDSDNPMLNLASVPNGPVGETALPLEVTTSDQGFGVFSVLVEAKGKGGETRSWSTPVGPGCTGMRSNECPHTKTLPVTYEPSALPDGKDTLTLTAFDAAGSPSAPQTVTITVDHIAPDTAIDSGPAAGEAISGSTATFTYHSTEAGSGFECKLDSGAFSPCSATGFTTPALATGSHTFSVRSRDQAGNLDASPAARTFFVGAPDTLIDSGPSGPVVTRTPSFTYHSTIPGSSFACSVDGGAFASCPASGFTTASLADGPHAFAVRATAGGVTDPTPATRSFTVDTTAPQTTIEFGPEGLVGSEIADFLYSSDDPEARFECRLDGSAFAACDAEEFETKPLADGAHSFAVRAVDALGNADPTPASREFAVDATAPTVRIESGPEGSTANPRPAVAFTATGGGTLGCAIEAAGSEREEPTYRACSSSSSDQPASPLPDGSYTFFVRTVDAAGNEDLDTRGFTVDTVAPQTTIDSGPAEVTDDSRPRFTFSASEPGVSFQCRFDAEAFRPCSGPGAADAPAEELLGGAHSFDVRATDAAGNADPTPATRSFTVEAEGPQTRIDSGPLGAIATTDASFEYSAEGLGRGRRFECQLDGRGFKECSASKDSNTGLAEGEHRFEVRATAGGLTDPTPAARDFVVDTSPPGVPVVSGALRDPDVPGLTLHLEVKDGDSSSPATTRSGVGAIRVSVDGTVVDTARAPCENDLCASSETRDLQLPYQEALGTHHFVVEAEDGVGHFSPVAVWDETTAAASTVELSEPPVPKGGCPKGQLNERGIQYRPHEVLGTPCSDLIVVKGASGETIKGFAGNDVIIGGAGKDEIFGGEGNDFIRSRRTDDEVFGEGGDDTIYGGVGDDVLKGGAGNDLIDGGPGFDVEEGEGGDDTLRGGQGGDSLIGGAGTDTVSYADAVPSTKSGIPSVPGFAGFPGNEPGVRIELAAKEGPFAKDGEIEEGGGLDTFAGIEKIVGSPFNDYIVGSSANETIDGGPGADFISGGGGSDTIVPDPRDFVEGESPKTFVDRDQSMIEIGAYSAPGSPETNVYLLGSREGDEVTANYLVGGQSSQVKFTAGSSAIAKRFAPQAPCGPRVGSTVTCPLGESKLGALELFGADGNDTLKLGTEAQNRPGTYELLGGSNRDTLEGGSLEELLVDGENQGSSPGREEILGGGGDDEVIQNKGADEVQGGPGNDLLISSDICHGDIIYGDVKPRSANPAVAEKEIEASDKTGSDNVQFHPYARGGVFADLEREELGEAGERERKCDGKSYETLSEANVIEASPQPDILKGNGGTNTILGRGGADQMYGRGGKDVLNARDEGRDKLINCGGQPGDEARIDFKKELVKGVLKENLKKPLEHPTDCRKVTNKGEAFASGLPEETPEEADEPGPGILGPTGEAIPTSPPMTTFLRFDETEGTSAANDGSGAPATYKAAGVGPAVNGPGPSLGEPGALAEGEEEAEGEEGQGRHAIALDGSSAYVDLAGQATPTEGESGAYSVAMFAKFSRAPGQREYLFSSSEGDEGVFLYRDPAGKIVFATGTEPGAPQVTSSEAITDDGWHFLVGTLEGNTITLYVDGFRYALGYGGSVLPKRASAAESLIGAGPGPSDFLAAEIDEFASFDGALTEAEVFADMAGSQAQAPELILPPVPETSDLDGDGVTDGLDNCPEVANPGQADVDENGIGDACEPPDADGDGVPDAADNCPHAYNPDQADSNGDGIGDECGLLPPTVATEAASDLKGTAAKLNGSVDPGGLPTTYRFEYGTTTAYGTSVPVEAKAIGSGAAAVTVSEPVAGLTPGTTYHCRVVASSEAGESEGADQTFTTPKPPGATSEAASAISATAATLSALVNPEGSPTTYQFEYGTTTAYGSVAPALPKEAGSGIELVAIGEALSGLAPGTTYHYRVVARSDGGTTDGQDRTFSTAPPPLAAQLEAMAITEPFNGSSSSLTDFSANFSKLGWAAEKGADTTTGWGPVGAFPAVNGVSYSAVLADTGPGLAAEATLATNPGIAERYFSLWLDVSSPQGASRSGYELRFADTAANTYTATLSKWQAGVQTVLASKSNLAFLNGNSFAIVDRGSTVSAWINTGSSFTQILGVEDAAFAAGQAGVEGAGNNTRLTAFRAASLPPL